MRGVSYFTNPVFPDGKACEDVFARQIKLRLPEGSRRVSFQSGLPLVLRDAEPALPVDHRGLRLQLIVKRLLDIVLSVVALLVLAPFLLLVAVRIRWDSPGPALFRQRREGLEGQAIEIVKFRSMYSWCADLSGRAQATHNDPRITSVGRGLRRKSIDELPQLIGVLKGEMSLVGPRPHAFGMLAGGMRYDQLVPYYAARHRQMKPGMTGWAQVNGLRGTTDDPHLARLRIDHDLAYIQNFSLWLDLRILLRTLRQEIFGGSGE